MKSILVHLFPLLVLASMASATDRLSSKMDARWFFSFGLGRNPADVEQIHELIDGASDHGLNGMVLSSFGLDRLDTWKAEDIAWLREIAAHCELRGIELIPTGFSAGYGGGALGHNRNFAAALPAMIPLRAVKGRLVSVPGPNLIHNGGLEDFESHRFGAYAFHDRPGTVSYADTEQAVEGRASIRFEGFGKFEHGHGRIMQKVAVLPGHSYRLSFKIRTRDLAPVSGLKGMIYAEGTPLASVVPTVKPTEDWTEVTLDFVNQAHREVSIYVGIWKGLTGAFWVDDLRFHEYGDLSDIVRREGCPLRLCSRARDHEFVEGKDFAEIRCVRRPPEVRILPGSAIREGEELELSGYKIPFVGHSWGKQISLCMSNPALYTYWEDQARKLHRIIPYKRYLLSMDEIRNGGGCETCRKSGKSMAEILGDCLTRQRDIFKAIDPGIEVLAWSDMLDPAHNAHDNYYGVVGDFSGSWQYAPKDLTVVCWYHKIRDESLAFFSGKGFRTLGAAYYDADDLVNPGEWLYSLRQTSGARGIMYTSWRKKYEWLAPFGDLVAGPELFAFDNGLQGLPSPREQVAVLKELGYAGIASRSGKIAALLPELDAAGLKMFSSYVPLRLKEGRAVVDPNLSREMELLKGRGTVIWLYIHGERSRDYEDAVVAALREIAGQAEAAGLPVVLYPHKGFYVATALDALRVADKVDHPNVSVSFNLCHFLMQNAAGEREAVLRKIAPRLTLVSINGADPGSRLPINKALQRLDRGGFDLAAFMKLLDSVGYTGPVGLQCYGIKGDDRENLEAAMKAWRQIKHEAYRVKEIPHE